MKTNKDLLQFLLRQMSNLEKDKIDVPTAKTHALIAKQANNALRYELDRANVQMKLSNHNFKTGENLGIRNVE